MTEQQQAAMRQALEALESYHGYMEPLTTVFGGPRVPAERSTTGKVEKAITALRQALEQPAAPAIPWTDRMSIDSNNQLSAPKPAAWVGLTEDAVYAAAEIAWRAGWAACRDAEFVGEEAEDEAWGYQGATVAQDTEAKLREKNGGKA